MLRLREGGLNIWSVFPTFTILYFFKESPEGKVRVKTRKIIKKSIVVKHFLVGRENKFVSECMKKRNFVAKNIKQLFFTENYGIKIAEIDNFFV